MDWVILGVNVVGFVWLAHRQQQIANGLVQRTDLLALELVRQRKSRS